MKLYSQPSAKNLRYRRPGMALYVSVMTTAMIVSLLSITGLAVVRIQRQETSMINDMLTARLYAQSALEAGLAELENDDQWRTNYTSGLESAPQELDPKSNGTISWILADSDGDLTDSDTSLTLQGIGRVGEAVQVLQVELGAEVLSSLGVAMHGRNLLDINDSEIDCDQIISSNNLVDESGNSNVICDVEAVNTISGDGYSGSTTTGVEAKTMPDGDVFDYYLANGTEIDYDALASGRIENTVLSAEYNPYGATNAQGIYVIYCNGAKIEFKNCVILGTIVLINPRNDSSIGQDHVFWQPAVANLPSLLVSGEIDIHLEGGDGLLNGIDSSAAGALNSLFGGVMTVGAGDTVDNLPSELNGLFYATGTIEIANATPTVNGVIISGNTLKIDEDMEVNYSSTFYDSPPPGFQTSDISMVTGSRTRVAAP